MNRILVALAITPTLLLAGCVGDELADPATEDIADTLATPHMLVNESHAFYAVPPDPTGAPVSHPFVIDMQHASLAFTVVFTPETLLAGIGQGVTVSLVDPDGAQAGACAATIPLSAEETCTIDVQAPTAGEWAVVYSGFGNVVASVTGFGA